MIFRNMSTLVINSLFSVQCGLSILKIQDKLMRCFLVIPLNVIRSCDSYIRNERAGNFPRLS